MKNLLKTYRAFFVLSHDAVAVVLAWGLAYSLRFNFTIPPQFVTTMMETLLFVLPVHMMVFVVLGLYKGVWRFASVLDLKRIVSAVGLTALVVTAAFFMARGFLVVPRSVLILNPILLVMMMGGSRFAYRTWREYDDFGASLKQGEPVIVLGAGDAAITLVKDLARSSKWRVVGLLDDDKHLIGRELVGVKVLGNIDSLPAHAAKFAIQHVILAMPSAKHELRKKAVALVNTLGLVALTVPAIDDLISGKVRVSQIRRVDVEDLLGRDVVALDNEGLQALIGGKVAFVSGAGGSIGAELCRQIIKFNPKTLVCFDISEFALYALEQSLATMQLQANIICVTGDVKNAPRVLSLLKLYAPEVVFHAAAYKHVPMMENHNVFEALNNNVIGTYTIAEACKTLGVPKFVLISTDKAVNPTNVMGASKRLAEMVCQGLHADTAKTKLKPGLKSKTTFVMVRFGNVLGSSGSVIPKFKAQIAAGGPITITHPEITRYFMSIPEAAQLVMQAGLMGQGGDIFVLDMGEPVKIVNLAEDMIRLSGLSLDDIAIEFVGLRPGEKLYEELLADDEHTFPTPHPKLRIANARSVDAVWVQNLLAWISGLQNSPERQIKQALPSWVEEYSPQLMDAIVPSVIKSDIVSEQSNITIH